MRIYYQLLGAHYHCRVFFNGLSGQLVVAEREWDQFRSSFATTVSWMPEEPEHVYMNSRTLAGLLRERLAALVDQRTYVHMGLPVRIDDGIAEDGAHPHNSAVAYESRRRAADRASRIAMMRETTHGDRPSPVSEVLRPRQEDEK